MKKRNWISVMVLIIALFGGIPGFISIKEHIFKTNIRIVYDQKQSFSCFIESDNEVLDEKLATGFWSFYVVGKGNVPIFLKEVCLYLRCRGKWIEGRIFKPKKNKFPDSKLGEVKCILLENLSAKKVIQVRITDWHDIEFSSEKTSLAFGEPLGGSIAFFFSLKEDDIKMCDKLKFEVIDFLGKTYVHETKIPAEFFKALKINMKLIDKDLSIR